MMDTIPTMRLEVQQIYAELDSDRLSEVYLIQIQQIQCFILAMAPKIQPSPMTTIISISRSYYLV